MATVHATYPMDTLQRLETMCLMSDIGLPLHALRAQIASAVDIIVQTSRLRDGSRCVTHISEVPSTTHPLGMRPAGEGGTTPALAVVVNAVVDALAEFGVRHVEMPTTPERIWRAIREARARSGAGSSTARA